MHTIAGKKLLMLRPDEISVPPDRAHRIYDEYELKLLADSISTNGIVEPVSVRRNAGCYELIAGERRLKAAKIAGLRRIPCVLHKVNDISAAFYAVIENLQRSDPDLFNQSESIKQLIDRYSLTHTEAAIRLGISQSTLTGKLMLLNLDIPLRHRITAANLSERQARALLRIEQAKRSEVLDKIIAQGLTVRQTELLIDEMLKPHTPEAKESGEPVRKVAIGDVRLFSNSLTKLIDTLKTAGIDVQTKKSETEKYIEYKIKIRKDSIQTPCRQLKIC